MIGKCKAAVVTALILGSTSTAFAWTESFDVNIYRPVPDCALDVLATAPAASPRSLAIDEMRTIDKHGAE
jgi:hypothetical protein